MLRPGPLNLITDVPGIAVGHASDSRVGTGVTTLALDGLWSAGVDVRGGGPGLRETEALAPENLVGRVHAIVLAGGSVFGLAAADGVAAALSARGVGIQLRRGAPPIPIVPAAVLHDLGNGGDKPGAWRHPTAIWASSPWPRPRRNSCWDRSAPAPARWRA
jgi:L-aminopeptidase/D-esterase-like protein